MITDSGLLDNKNGKKNLVLSKMFKLLSYVRVSQFMANILILFSFPILFNWKLIYPKHFYSSYFSGINYGDKIPEGHHDYSKLQAKFPGSHMKTSSVQLFGC